MFTIHEICQHVITGKAYPEKSISTGYRNSRIYQKLEAEATPEIIEKVRNFVEGKLSEAEIGKEINAKSAYNFLAGAKVVDFDIDLKRKQSTYKIREMALFRSTAENSGRGEINMLNAFSMPPLDLGDGPLDILLANELDNNHPLVQKAAYGNERNEILRAIYGCSQERTKIIPEMVPVIEDMIRDRMQAMLEIAEKLQRKTRVFFKGATGTGKTRALIEFYEKHVKETKFTVYQAVQSTDSVKNDLRSRIDRAVSDQHAHLLGLSVLKMFLRSMRDKFPGLSTLEEGWMNSKEAIKGLFEDSAHDDLRLEIYDFDGDFEALLLRVIERYNRPNSATPPLGQVERGFKTSRESREQLLTLIGPQDSYQCSYVDKEGSVDEHKDAKSIESNPEKVDEEILAAKLKIVSEDHVRIFGNSLKPFVGLTIKKAFEEAQKTLQGNPVAVSLPQVPKPTVYRIHPPYQTRNSLMVLGGLLCFTFAVLVSRRRFT